jgi:tRNA-specific 2-thiouridylase
MQELPEIILPNIEKGSLVAVAMSGGVDSSTVACLVKNSGYNVIGITLQLYDQNLVVNKKGACCAGQDIYDAKMVADQMGFSHYVLDYENIFRQSVIDDFIDTYLQGETPIPCIRCNQKVKFKDLLKTAKDIGAKALVTGHYVRKIIKENISQMHRAIDRNKDQSYFLFSTTKEQLDYLHFPLGEFTKEKTREIARTLGLKISEKPDSQDICFVPNGGYAKVVEKFRAGVLEDGDIVHVNGTVLGRHQGIINYTIGQRKGLGVSYHEPLYVVKLDPASHTVFVGSKEDLGKKQIIIKDMNWLINDCDLKKPFSCDVKIRSSGNMIKVFVEPIENNKCVIIFNTLEYGVAAGQACVLYEQDRLLGGGWITNEV